MKTKTTMLEYCKMVLQSVSFNKQLFKKEYRKSMKWLKHNELLQLKDWIRNDFRPSTLVLRNSRVMMLGCFVTMAFLSTAQRLDSQVALNGKVECPRYTPYARYVDYPITQQRAQPPVSSQISTRPLLVSAPIPINQHAYAGYRSFAWGAFGRIRPESTRLQRGEFLEPIVSINLPMKLML
jgi:hypothetical protein